MKYLLLPVISAFIGWLTNYIAVKMIFHPRREIRVLGISIQGLLPKRRRELAESIGRTVERELIYHDDIGRILRDPSFREGIISVIGAKLDEFLTKRIGILKVVLRTSTRERIVGKIRDALSERIVSILPELSEQAMDLIETQLDFRKIVVDRVETFDLQRLERLVYRVAGAELRYIEIWGGVLGFFIGVIQALLVRVFWAE